MKLFVLALKIISFKIFSDMEIWVDVATLVVRHVVVQEARGQP